MVLLSLPSPASEPNFIVFLQISKSSKVLTVLVNRYLLCFAATSAKCSDELWGRHNVPNLIFTIYVSPAGFIAHLLEVTEVFRNWMSEEWKIYRYDYRRSRIEGPIEELNNVNWPDRCTGLSKLAEDSQTRMVIVDGTRSNWGYRSSWLLCWCLCFLFYHAWSLPTQLGLLNERRSELQSTMRALCRLVDASRLLGIIPDVTVSLMK